MSVQVEKMEGNLAKLTIEISADKVEDALVKAYNKQKGSVSVPGFRKGKVPYQMFIKMYGPEVLYEDAANDLLKETYPDAYDESGLDIVSAPEVDIVKLEKGQPFVYTATVATKPPVKLGKYKGVSVTKLDESVSAEEIQAELDKQREENARLINIEDRAAKIGDTIILDFDGYMDGKQFEGGKGEGYTLELGSNTFIEGFEDQMVGMEIGQEGEVNVTFPENYGVPELAGKPAVFKVKLHEIKEKELPEVDDEFAQEVSDYDTLEEYKKSIEEKLSEAKKNENRLTQEDEAINQIVEGCEIDVPQMMIEAQAGNMVEEMAQNLAMSGISMEQYFQITGTDMKSFREQCMPRAEQRIKTALVLEAIAKAEDVQISDEAIDAELTKMAEQYNMDVETLIKVTGEEQRKQIAGDLETQAAIDIIFENAKFTAAKKTTKKASEKAADKDEKASEDKETKKPAAKKTTKKASEKAADKDDKASDGKETKKPAAKKPAAKKTTKKADAEKAE